MRRRIRKMIAAVVMLSASGFAASSGCPAVVDSVWEAGMTAAGTTIDAAIESMMQTISTTRANNLMRVQSALRVMTKQIDAASNKEIATNLAAEQATSGLAVELANRKAVFHTIMDYNVATGQGFDPCAEIKRSQDVAVAIGEANIDMTEKVIRELDAAPGKLTSNRSGMVAARMSQAKSVYCTADEVRMGLCGSVGAFAGKDVDSANFFKTAVVGTGDANAKSAMLNSMYGVPYQAITKQEAATPNGKAFLEAKRNEDAIRSVSQTSMKAIQSWTEERGTSTNKSDSVLEALGKKVNTYAGGDGYAEWEKSKTSQSERGLLVEYAKMAATELYMLHIEYQQLERIEANIATWQALSVRGAMKSNVPIGDGGASKVKQ